MVVLYGHAGRLIAENGGFRRGQSAKVVAERIESLGAWLGEGLLSFSFSNSHLYGESL